MMRFPISVLLVAFVSSLVLVSNASVLELTTSDFQSTIEQKAYALISFTAPWCGHCKALKPEFAKAAESFKENEQVVLANVDCTVEKDLCGQFDVRGYPTMKWFAKGKPTDYEGGRTGPAIIEYVTKYSGPALTHVAKDDLAAFTTSSRLVAVAFLGDSNDQNSLIEQLAEEFRSDVRFGVYSGTAGLPDLVKSTPAVVLHRSFGEPVLLQGSISSESFSDLLKMESFPLVDEISPENYRMYLSRGLPLVWVFTPSTEDQSALLETLQVAAGAAKGKLSVVHLDGVEYARHAENMGLNTDNLPALVIDDFEAKKKYIFSEAFDSETLAAFFTKYVGGELTANVKSEPIPESNDAPVTVVVGKQFDEIVLDDSKDVLLELYAPWCGHCKSLAPKYDQLGEIFASIPSVVIAKVDATANDVDVDFQGFPTIKLFPAGSKSSPIDFEGERSVAAMAEFVLKNVGVALTEDQKKAVESNAAATAADDASADDDEAKDEL